MIRYLVIIKYDRLLYFKLKISLDYVQFQDFLENSQNSHIEEANFQKLGMIVGISAFPVGISSIRI